MASLSSGSESNVWDPSDSSQRSSRSSPRSRLSRIKVDVLRTWSPPDSFYFSIGDREYEVFTVLTSFALSLRAGFSHASKFSSSSMSATKMSPFQSHTTHNAYPRNIPRKTFLPNWLVLDRSLAEIGSYSIIEPNGTIGPLNGSPNRRS